MLPTSYYNTACLCFLPPKVANFAYLVAYGRACHYTPFFDLFMLSDQGQRFYSGQNCIAFARLIHTAFTFGQAVFWAVGTF